MIMMNVKLSNLVVWQNQEKSKTLWNKSHLIKPFIDFQLDKPVKYEPRSETVYVCFFHMIVSCWFTHILAMVNYNFNIILETNTKARLHTKRTKGV